MHEWLVAATAAQRTYLKKETELRAALAAECGRLPAEQQALLRRAVPLEPLVFAAREAKKRRETGHAVKVAKGMRKLRSVRKVASTR